MRIALLDDYQNVALSCAPWGNLPPECQVVAFADHEKDEDRLVARLADFDAVGRVRERTLFPRRVLERLPRLKLLLATGLRNDRSIDLPAAADLGITVCSTTSHSFPTVEVTWAMILSLFRGIHHEVASVRNGGWQVQLGSAVRGKTLGILGLGTMGIPVAQVGQAFGMKLIAWSPNLTQHRAGPHGVEAVSKEELFARSDAITIHMPESERSVGVVGAPEIARMKKSAFLINTSRMPLIDEDAMIAALRAGRIGGAGLDVYNDEPLPRDHPYRHLPNVLATPHIGYVIRENYELYYGETVENIQAFLAGRPIRVLGPDGKIRT
ncbi:D-2-hydroxyacid dehydrogenase family protein [Starkeya sp. ORNL1]|uniref:D-2-hydroxyacid dehydrogenase family protein n=1 Tax=Starkeya sp. ORNL1 TaxID=2709380 RepID=UPI0014639FED|nr:D-2-hydroxyacid dehydrogenase family protein [Starkeya sp. ORNL1]QJP14131.1 D-2-hydroxyacid dehydrogenase family protein [Starkeya sp. ORNL1]